MRVSILREDRDYNPMCIHGRVILNGKEIHDCVTLDEEVGRVLRHDFQNDVFFEDSGEVKLDLSNLPAGVDFNSFFVNHTDSPFYEPYQKQKQVQA